MRQIPFVSVLALTACGGAAPPSGIALGPENPITTDDLIPTVGGSENLSDYSVRWYVNGTRRLDLDGETMVPAALTNKGEEWAVGVASAPNGEYGQASVVIQNSPPVATLTVLPESPLTTDPIRTVVTQSDLDSGNVRLTYSWTVDGTAVDFPGSILPQSFTSKGQVWEVTVVPSDDEGDGEPVSGSVTIGNSPPSVVSAVISPAFPTGNDTLNCDGRQWTDPDDDAPSYTYEWLFEGSVVGTGPTLAASALERGDSVVCRLTPTDGQASGPPVESRPVTITNAAPIVTAINIVPDPATKLDALSVEPVEIIDIDDDPVTLSYRWFVNGASVSTEATLEPRYYKRDDTVQVRVIPNDGFINGEAVSSPEIVIGNTPPVVNTVTVSQTELYTDTVVRVNGTASDLDRDSVTISYEWFVNGTSVATTQEISGEDYFDKGDTVQAEVTANDGVDDSAVVSSTLFTVLNTPPTRPGIAMDPDDAGPGDKVVCTLTEASTDVDGDSITYTFDWTRDGSAFGGTSTTTYTNDTLPASTSSSDELYICSVTPFDGTDDGVADKTVLNFREGPFEFTRCGKTGNTGPSQTDCDSAYAGTDVDSSVTVSKGIQTWLVPKTGTWRIEAAGAQGSSVSTSGGCGATIRGDYELTSGDELTILVGQIGQHDGCSSGGGGASFVLDDAGDAVLVAGGGGGARTGASSDGCDGRTTEYAGTSSVSSSSWGCGAKSTGLTAGGTSSSSWGSGGGGLTSNGSSDSSCSGTCGGYAPVNGGDGGGSSSSPAYGGFGAGGGGNGSCGGGGGGGYSGGDGGYVAGGGGSYNDGANQSNTAGGNCDHGYVTLTYIEDEE